MDGPLIEISSAGADRLHELAPVFGRAFADDPMMRWSMTGKQDPTVRFTHCFAFFLEAALELDLVWEADMARGAAVWIPPGRCEVWEEHPWNQRRILELSDDGGERYDSFWSWIEVQSPNEPLWQLDSIAVDPIVQGRGYGGALIQAGLTQAAAEGIGAFLSTGTERNVSIYSKYGFRVVNHMDAPDHGPHMWFMRWDP
jgi:GNAT superfamily N-acetyltransferase